MLVLLIFFLATSHNLFSVIKISEEVDFPPTFEALQKLTSRLSKIVMSHLKIHTFLNFIGGFNTIDHHHPHTTNIERAPPLHSSHMYHESEFQEQIESNMWEGYSRQWCQMHTSSWPTALLIETYWSRHLASSLDLTLQSDFLNITRYSRNHNAASQYSFGLSSRHHAALNSLNRIVWPYQGVVDFIDLHKTHKIEIPNSPQTSNDTVMRKSSITSSP